MKTSSKKTFAALRRILVALIICAMLSSNAVSQVKALDTLDENPVEEQNEDIEQSSEVVEAEEEPEALIEEAEEEIPEDEVVDEETPAEETPEEEAIEEEAPAEEPAEEEEVPVEEPAEEASEPEAEPEEEITYPAVSFSDKAGLVSVSVSAPEGAFPQGTRMKVTPVFTGEVKNAVEEAVDGTVKKYRAVDITFYNAAGQEIEPLVPISVVLSASDIADEDAVIVHMPDAGDAEVVEDTAVVGAGVAFESDAFSVYVVVETGEDARLSVNFVLADGSTKTMMINKRQIPHIDQYIYDPGANEPDGTLFKGWTTVENYDSDTEAETIADVRDDVEAELNKSGGVTDGDELTYYAMVFNAYKVIYRDERGITVKIEQVLLRTDDTTKPTHDVTLDYTPYPTGEEGVSAEFMGWQQIQPEVSGEMVLYQPGDSFELEEEEYILKAYTQKGYWLSFDENLSGATYTEPQFVAIGGKPTKPANPSRTGYTFNGWYTQDADPDARDGQVSGSEFNFNLEMTENTTVYAKWTKATRADYSVVIWKQNVDGEHYDYGETVTVSNATVGNDTYALSARTVDGRNGVRINTGGSNTDKSYVGFHLSTTKPNSNGYDAPKTVAAEGNTIINVYFDRDTITYIFDSGNGSTQSFSGLYGSAFTQWPNPGNGKVWQRQNGFGMNATVIRFPLPLTEYNPASAAIVESERDDTSFTFTLTNFDQDYTLTVYKMTDTGAWSYTDADIIATAPLESGWNPVWIPSETYTGFTLNAYRKGANGAWNTDVEPTTRISYSSNLYLRYSRNQYSIVYRDGIFVDGSGNPVEDAINRGELTDLKEAKVYYESNISSKNKTPEYDGYVFLGWYDNEACVGDPYPFTTMPANNVTLYAKWGLNEFEIVLHPNDSTDDPIKYNSESQAVKFYVNTGEKIGEVGGERIYYDLVGWYCDEGFTHVFDFDAFRINKQTVKKYGKIYSADEIDPEYPTTIGQLNLYAKWRGKLIGADGITVEYVDGEHGTDRTVVDEHQYVDGANTNAHSGFEAGDEDYVFSHWEVQKWDGSKFTASGVKVFPGNTFEVKAADAKITEKDHPDTVVDPKNLDKNTEYVYTIQVKAVYIEKDKEVLTRIHWYYNYEGAPSDGLYVESKDLKINEAMDIPDAPERTGYNFLGWIRGFEEDSDDGTTTEEDLWLTYEDGAYTYDEGKTAEQVAADEMLVGDNGDKHHALYAKWEAAEEPYTVEFYYQNDSGEGYTKDDSLTDDTRKAKTDTTVQVTAEDKGQTKDGKYKLVEGSPSVFSAKVAGDGSTVLKLYFDLNPVSVTVEHYLLGETKAFKTDTIEKQTVGSTYTATPETKYQGKDLTVDSKDPESGSIQVAGSDNVIKIYYTLPLTITAENKEKTYDGKPLEGEYTIEGALDADQATIEGKLPDVPSITNVSESPKEYLTTDEQSAITGIPAYYAVTYTPGTLKINPIDKKVTVTVTEKSDKVTYDGEEHTVKGYKSIKADNDLYDVKKSVKETETEDWTAAGTNAGKYDLGISADDFENINKNFSNVEFKIVDGKLTINKVKITLKSGSAEKVYDGDPLTNEEVTIEGEMPAADLERFSYKATGSQTYVGTSKNTIEYGFEAEEEPTPQSDNIIVMLEETIELLAVSPAENYDISVEEGDLTVTKPDDEDVVTKSHEDGEYKVGDEITFTIEVTNVYDENKTITIEEIEGVEVEQSEFKDVAPGETVSTTATYTVTEEDAEAGTFKNTVTVKFSDEDDEYTGEDEVPIEGKGHATIKKTVTNEPKNKEGFIEGETIEYEIKIKNDGDVTLENIKISDELTGDEWTVESLEPGDEQTFTTKYEVTADDVKAGSVTNIATAEGDGDPEIDPGEVETPTYKEEEEEEEEPAPTPQTGDNSMTWLWMVVMLAAGLELASLIYVKVRKNQ